MVDALSRSFSVNSSNSKRQQLFEKAKLGKTDDKISSLPDVLLCHILSFLPTKYAVRTCILSRRWKYLWTSVNNLEFDDNFGWPIDESIQNCFMNFVDRVLDLSNVSSLQRFRLNCWQCYELSRLNGWICIAILRHVQELDLKISTNKSFEFPLSLFNCQTLGVLKLGSRSKFPVNVPLSVCFSNLKILHLESAEYLDDVKKLLSGCPNIQELKLSSVNFKNMHRLCVHSSSLKILTISTYIPCPAEYEHNIVIDTPQLEYLCLRDGYSKGVKANELPLLHKASVSVSQGSQKSVTSEEFGDSVIELLQRISNVKHLQLFQDVEMSVHQAQNYNLPLFINMTQLEMEVGESWLFVANLLECSPNLEVLRCRKVHGCSINRRRPSICMWHPPDFVPKCFSSRLATVEIKGSGCENEMKLVEYILKNAVILKKMLIVRSWNFVRKWESKILKELLMIPRGSITCQVDIA